MNWEIKSDLCVKETASGKLLQSTGHSARCSVMTQRGGMRVPEGGDKCKHVANSLHCTAETNTLKSNYTHPHPPKKKKRIDGAGQSQEGRKVIWAERTQECLSPPQLQMNHSVTALPLPSEHTLPSLSRTGSWSSHTCNASVGFSNQLATGHCPWPSSRLCCCCCCLVTKQQVVSDSFATPWTEAHQGPLSMGFPTGKSTGWAAISSSRGSVLPRDGTHVSSIGKWILYHWASWEAPAAAAKSFQSCPTLCDPIDGSPPGLPVPEILQARTLEWVAISFSSAWKWKVKVKSLSRVRLLATPWTAAYQAPPSMGFSRQEYWSGCHCLLWGST